MPPPPVFVPPDLLLVLATLAAPDLDDAALAERIRTGDERAFRAFFERHHDALYGYLRRRRVSPDVCDDLVQNAFLYVWQNRQQIEPGKSLRAYLFRIAHTRALNHFRDTRRLTDDTALDFEPADLPGPDDHAEHAMMQEALHAAIATLPDKRREVFELCFVEGLTYREAAEALEISVKTVENQMGAALKTIRVAMQSFL